MSRTRISLLPLTLVGLLALATLMAALAGCLPAPKPTLSIAAWATLTPTPTQGVPEPTATPLPTSTPAPTVTDTPWPTPFPPPPTITPFVFVPTPYVFFPTPFPSYATPYVPIPTLAPYPPAVAPSPPMVALGLNPSTTQLVVGQSVAISADAVGQNITFRWSVARGSLSTYDTPAVIYTAPVSPGVDTVTVAVTNAGGTTFKSVSFSIVMPTPVVYPTPYWVPTPTPYWAPTPTPYWAPTPTPYWAPTPTPFIPTPTPMPTPAYLSPDQTVVAYYRAVSSHQYNISWPMLSNYFKDKWNPPAVAGGEYNYASYREWWDRVAQVNMNQVSLVEQSGSMATVYVDLSYLMYTGETVPDPDHYIQLIFDLAPLAQTGDFRRQVWLFYDKLVQWPQPAPTPLPTLVPPTPLPTPVPPTPLPTPVPLTVVPIPLPSPVSPAMLPDQAVNSYYQAINTRDYNTGWTMLSPAFKYAWNCCTHSGGYDYNSYVKWWDRVEQVAITNVAVVNQSENHALVYADISYTMKDGQQVADPYAYTYLVRDRVAQRWLFEMRGPSAQIADAPQAPPPDQMVRDYYTAVGSHLYNLSWPMLSAHFKAGANCCTPDGEYDYDGYTQWWDKVERVELGSVKVVEQTDTTATVSADLAYLLKTGEWVWDSESTIHLILDPNIPAWLFYAKGATGQSFPTPAASGPPELAVRRYYEAINAHDYGVTWPMLSIHFKSSYNCCTPQGDFDFQGYKDWWDSVERVNVVRLETVAQTNNTATVLVEMVYQMKDGRQIPDTGPYIKLVFDPVAAMWLFWDKGQNP